MPTALKIYKEWLHLAQYQLMIPKWGQRASTYDQSAKNLAPLSSRRENHQQLQRLLLEMLIQLPITTVAMEMVQPAILERLSGQGRSGHIHTLSKLRRQLEPWLFSNYLVGDFFHFIFPSSSCRKVQLFENQLGYWQRQGKSHGCAIAKSL